YPPPSPPTIENDDSQINLDTPQAPCAPTAKKTTYSQIPKGRKSHIDSHCEPVWAGGPSSGRFRLLAAGGLAIRGSSVLLFERNACALSGGQGTFASSGCARIASLTRAPVRSTGKEPSPEDGPPAQT